MHSLTVDVGIFSYAENVTVVVSISNIETDIIGSQAMSISSLSSLLPH